VGSTLMPRSSSVLISQICLIVARHLLSFHCPLRWHCLARAPIGQTKMGARAGLHGEAAIGEATIGEADHNHLVPWGLHHVTRLSCHHRIMGGGSRPGARVWVEKWMR
jgi:hypothetical protein